MERTKCVCMMPFGRPVVPLVYMMLNRSSCATGTRGGSAEATERSSARLKQPGSAPSTSTMRRCSTGGNSSRIDSITGSIDTCVTSAEACESASSPRRPGPISSGDSGTFTAPSDGMAKVSSTSSRQLPSRLATLSPRRMPKPASAFAVRFTRSASCA